MTEAASRALISLGCFVGVGAALMLPLTEAGTATRIVCILALILGVLIVGGAVAMRLLGARRRDFPVSPTVSPASSPTHTRGREDAATAHHDEAVVTTKENP